MIIEFHGKIFDTNEFLYAKYIERQETNFGNGSVSHKTVGHELCVVFKGGQAINWSFNSYADYHDAYSELKEIVVDKKAVDDAFREKVIGIIKDFDIENAKEAVMREKKNGKI